MSELERPDAAPSSPKPAAPARRLSWVLGAAVILGTVVPLAFILASGPTQPAVGDDKQAEKAAPPAEPEQPAEKKKVAAPELDGGVAWLNTAGPLSLKKDLKGKVVLLDFWTLCCINCIHILPDLAKLEKKYANELVVIGVHSPKFENEKDTESIRKAILRYQIEHPVVNDADHKIWDRYEVDAWPTLVLIDPEGNLVGYTSGEGNYELLDTVVGQIVVETPARRRRSTRSRSASTWPKYRENGDTPALLPRQGAGRREGQAAVHRRQHAPPRRHHRPGRQVHRRRRHRRARQGRRRVRQGAVRRPAGDGAAAATRSTSPTARTTSSAHST